MATPVVDRSWRRSTPDRIDTDLAGLWRDLERGSPVARALMSNLIVVRQGSASDAVDLQSVPVDLPLEAVMAQHPSRLVVLYHDTTADACRPLAAAVGVLTFGSGGSRYGIELIAVRAACHERSLPSIVRRLTIGGLPTTVWWNEDLSTVPPLASLVTMGRQLLSRSARM